MDELLRAMQEVSVQVLPILGVIVLFFLVLVLRRIYKLLGDVGLSVIKLNTTIDKINGGLDELKAPLSTLSRLSHSVDVIHSATESALKSAIGIVIENFDWIKDSVSQFVSKSTTKNQVKGENHE